MLHSGLIGHLKLWAKARSKLPRWILYINMICLHVVSNVSIQTCTKKLHKNPNLLWPFEDSTAQSVDFATVNLRSVCRKSSNEATQFASLPAISASEHLHSLHFHSKKCLVLVNMSVKICKKWMSWAVHLLFILWSMHTNCFHCLHIKMRSACLQEKRRAGVVPRASDKSPPKLAALEHRASDMSCPKILQLEVLWTISGSTSCFGEQKGPGLRLISNLDCSSSSSPAQPPGTWRFRKEELPEAMASLVSEAAAFWAEFVAICAWHSSRGRGLNPWGGWLSPQIHPRHLTEGKMPKENQIIYVLAFSNTFSYLDPLTFTYSDRRTVETTPWPRSKPSRPVATHIALPEQLARPWRPHDGPTEKLPSRKIFQTDPKRFWKSSRKGGKKHNIHGKDS